MKNLYLILRKDSNKNTLKLLKSSAAQRKIKIKKIITENFDFSKTIELTKEDGLYNLCDDLDSQIIEKHLINNKCRSFYKNYLDCIHKIADVDDLTSVLIHSKLGLPVIKTIVSLTNDKKLLKKYVEHLDGFPIIIKSLGGSHGVGVMKIDSLESLYSTADYLHKQKDNFILRKFIDYSAHARLIVLNNKAISSIEYKKIKNDFRSNVGDELLVENKKFGKKIEKIAIASVGSLGYAFGGVDILIDQHGNPYIAEVNFPCYFPRAQQFSKVDISGKMIDYLIKTKNRSR